MHSEEEFAYQDKTAVMVIVIAAMQDSDSGLSDTVVRQYWRDTLPSQQDSSESGQLSIADSWDDYQRNLQPFYHFEERRTLTETQVVRETLSLDVVRSARFLCVHSSGRWNRCQRKYPSGSSHPGPPSFTKTPKKHIFLLIGGNLTIECNAYGVPKPTVEWTGSPLGPTQGRSKQQDGRLSISNAQMNDSGNYTCRASSKLGVINTTTELVVLGKGEYHKSCKEAYDDGHREDKAYSLYLESGKHQVYCHMSEIVGCGSGGFTMVMKINGTKDTYLYDSDRWTNKEAYNVGAGVAGFDEQETKLSTYWESPFSKVCLGMKVGVYLRFISIDQEAPSLYSLIADGQYRVQRLWVGTRGSR